MGQGDYSRMCTPRPCGGAGKHECPNHEVRAGGGFVQFFMTRPRIVLRNACTLRPRRKGGVCGYWNFVLKNNFCYFRT